jgi:hypothetical protein
MPCFASKSQESHPRQWVDGSDLFYRQLLNCTVIPPTAVGGWFRSLLQTAPEPHCNPTHGIETMPECCRNSRPIIGLGALCLGAEAIVPKVYSTILNGFDAVREPRENLHFFTIHVSDDDEHAHTMRNIILRELSNNSRSRHDLEYGAARALDARVEFFEGISEAVND